MSLRSNSVVVHAIRTARNDGKFDVALALALGAWRQSRHPVIADVIDLLHKEVDFRPPKCRTKEEFHQAWCALADASPSDAAVGWLAENFRVKLPIDADYFGILRPNYVLEKYRAVFERVDRLTRLPTDPRIAACMADELIAGRFMVYGMDQSTEQIYGPMMALLAACGDSRQGLRLGAGELRSKSSGVREYLGRRLPSVVATLGNPDPSVEEELWLSLFPAPVSGVATDPSDVLAGIYADPSDNGLRAIYADLLQDAGDPRGEFIAIQLAQHQATATEAQAKRARSLLRKHKDEWLGDLARVFTGVEFDRGFPVSGAVAPNAQAPAAVWERSIGAAALGTFEEIRRGRGNARHLGALTRGAANLATIHVGSNKGLEELLKLTEPRCYQTVHMSRLLPAALLTRMAKSPVFDQVAHLALDLGHQGTAQPTLERLEGAGLLKRMETLTISVWGDGMAFEAAALFWPRLPDTFRRLRCGLELERKGDGLIAKFAAYAGTESLESALSSVTAVLPPATEWHIRCSAETADQVQVLAAAQIAKRPDKPTLVLVH
jgi:uncharacterized protein (TIGR02996 family)